MLELTAKEIITAVVATITLGGGGFIGLIKSGHLQIGKNNGKNNKASPANDGVKNVDKRVDSLTAVVQYTSTCVATHKAVDQRLGRIEAGIDTLIARK